MFNISIPYEYFLTICEVTIQDSQAGAPLDSSGFIVVFSSEGENVICKSPYSACNIPGSGMLMSSEERLVYKHATTLMYLNIVEIM